MAQSSSSGTTGTRAPRAKCEKASDRADIGLPILADSAPKGIQPSTMSRWRAASLILVHVLIIAHILHWLARGETITPIEPSESMQTVNTGAINAGFIFFAAAIIATFVLGRWLCGWGCHLVAYQDLTLWVLKKLRLRPKAFRSRVLIFVPLAAAFYMFILPPLYRWLVGAPAPPWSLHLMTTGFWDTFPQYGIAILTVAVCGVAMIYLLGAKGFCTYACPYGGFFALADRFAPARIRVTDACHQCGHCTAVCTSNVDVAKEVKLYQMVVDPGCMKCLDCVSVCPNEALYYGWGAPALGRRPVSPPKPRQYDFTIKEELAAAAIFIGSWLALRGLYEAIPFLLSLGMAGVATFLLMKAARLFYEPDVLVQRAKLKVGGRIAPFGWTYVAMCLVLVAFLLHSGLWRYHDFAGNIAFGRSPPDTFRWQYEGGPLALSSEQKANVLAGISHLEACQRIGLIRTTENDLELAWLYLQAGQPESAAQCVEAVIGRKADEPNLWLHLAKIQTAAGDLAAARKAYDQCRELEAARRAEWSSKLGKRPMPMSAEIMAEWGMFLGHLGEADAAMAELARAAAYDRTCLSAQLALAHFQERMNLIDDARGSLLAAARIVPHSPVVVASLNRIAKQNQNHAAAAADYESALKDFPGSATLHQCRAYALAELKRYPESLADYRRALELEPGLLTARADFGAVLMISGDLSGAAKEYEFIVSKEPNNSEAALRLAYLYLQIGRGVEAVSHLQRVVSSGSPQQRGAAQEMLNQIQAGGSRP